MKLGTIIELPDGRRGTVVFNGLCGVGIRWGELNPDPEDFKNSHGDVIDPLPEVTERLVNWKPEAYLRESCPTADLPCVGTDYEIIKEGVGF